MSHQPYHLVDQSPWPLLASFNTMALVISLTLMMQYQSINLLILSSIIMIMTAFQWWRDVIRESSYQGHHSLQVTKGLKLGMILFILSEIMFFISFFWTFFHSSLSPNIQIGSSWPPSGITPFNPSLVPLLNTTILISSGISVTWAHHSLINSNYNHTFYALMITISLGLYFTSLQAWEYLQAPFTMADSIYGSTFFIATGFHGLHVLIGTLFLIVVTLRIFLLQMSSTHHFGFEAAAWYWHFVDVVWLFLYTVIYWWAN